jgi:hypothetical protein
MCVGVHGDSVPIADYVLKQGVLMARQMTAARWHTSRRSEGPQQCLVAIAERGTVAPHFPIIENLRKVSISV